ncbi:major facilitator superfamily domain-containing protein [Chiua virens]|nr:major facilitator superfamily domain-containing protein [Chiua virens]
MSTHSEHLSEEQAESHVHVSDEIKEVECLNERRRLALKEINDATFSRFHVKICLVAGAGFFTDAYDIFAIIIAVTMLGFVYGSETQDNLPSLKNWESTGLKLATPAGNLIGQILFGWFADTLGRKRMYGVELSIMIVATFGQAVSGWGPHLNIVYILIFWRVMLGIGVGGDYPLSAIITSEFAPVKIRGRMMTAVFASQGLGQLAASLVGLVVVVAFKEDIQHATTGVDYAWRLLIGLGCIPAVIALYFRLTVPETPRFTMDIKRHVRLASHDIEIALATSGYYTVYISDDDIHEPHVTAPLASRRDFIAYFSKLENFKLLFGTAYSWFALDIAFYTLTLDITPNPVSINFGLENGNVYQSLINVCVGNIILSFAGYIPGFAAAFFLVDVLGRKMLQLMGFSILTILFWIMGFGFNHLSGHAFLILYCLANFFQNFGPNTTTFIVPGEIFPTRYRATGHGISAASGKLGAVVAQILFAVAKQNLNVILEVLSFVMMTGVFSTLLICETKGETLEDLSNENQATYITGTGERRAIPPSAAASQMEG